jgi:hypothetical protein
MSDRPGRVTAALLFLVLLFCIYRARTQSLTIDEAWVFKRFVNQPISEMTRSWDACNHVLHTVLMKCFGAVRPYIWPPFTGSPASSSPDGASPLPPPFSFCIRC